MNWLSIQQVLLEHLLYARHSLGAQNVAMNKEE